MHLIATREDLGTFAHVHPEPTGSPGELAVDVTFPTAGTLHRQHRVPAARRDGRRAPAAARHRRRRRAGSRSRSTAGPRTTVVDGVAGRARRRGRRRGAQRPALRVHRRRHRPSRSTTCSRSSPRPATSWSCAATARPSPTSTPRSRTTDGRPVFALPGPGVRARARRARRVRHARAPTSCGDSSAAPTGDVLTVPFTVEAR